MSEGERAFSVAADSERVRFYRNGKLTYEMLHSEAVELVETGVERARQLESEERFARIFIGYVLTPIVVGTGLYFLAKTLVLRFFGVWLP